VPYKDIEKRRENNRKRMMNAVCPHCHGPMHIQAKTCKKCMPKLAKTKHSAGYWQVYKPDHPRSLANGRVYEHLLIAERALGRPLISYKEVVHHINGDPADNRKCNLLICGEGYHRWLHHEMSKRYMKEHFGGR
jgi:hypothetical protein